MNWTVDNNGAYDYAADTRGIRLGCHGVSRPELGNSWASPDAESGKRIEYDWHPSQAHGDNIELELHRGSFQAVRESCGCSVT